MKWRSVSIRLSLILLGLTLGSLFGLTLALDMALKRFFVQSAQMRLTRQAEAFATQVEPHWGQNAMVQQWSDLMAQQGALQVVVFNADSAERLRSEGVDRVGVVELPANLIGTTLMQGQQKGRFWVSSDPLYPWWLYGTAPIAQGALSEPVGAIYVAMPLRRPKQFAQQVKGMVIGMAAAAAGVSAVAAMLLSRSITHPLYRLQQQAAQLKAGNYEARSQIKGQDELAQLSRLLNQMAARLSQTLQALQAQETARRELVANVSHDLRTPLAALRVELEAVLDGIVTGKKAQQYLRRACREIDFLSRLVDQLLLLAKADAGQLQVQPQAVSAVAIAQECLSRMELIAAQSALEICLNAEAALPQVWVDPKLTGQVVLNLLDNAVKYAPASEVIDVNARSPITVEGKGYVPLEVRDRGPGIEPAILQRITERFYRASSARPKGGLGLGLAIAQQVCQLQNALLEIESQPTQGTTVRLLLPVQAS